MRLRYALASSLLFSLAAAQMPVSVSPAAGAVVCLPKTSWTADEAQPDRRMGQDTRSACRCVQHRASARCAPTRASLRWTRYAARA